MRMVDAEAIQYEPMLSAKGNGMYEDVMVAYKSQIDDLPTIEERKKGKWIIDDDWDMCDIEGTLIGTKEFECDKCGYRELVFDGTVTHLNFCPNCGADMRGEGHE